MSVSGQEGSELSFGKEKRKEFLGSKLGLQGSRVKGQEDKVRGQRTGEL